MGDTSRAKNPFQWYYIAIRLERGRTRKERKEMEANIEIHQVDGWEALYVNGECVQQGLDGDTLESWIALRQRAGGLPLTIKSWKRIYHDAPGGAVRFALRKGRLPETLAELKALEAQ